MPPTPGPGNSAGSTPGSGHTDPDAQVFVISVAAQLAGMHAQTLRTYDRLGLVTPQRTTGGGRRYSPRDVALLREVQRLSQNEGVNLAGIKRIIELTNQVEALQTRVTELAQELANVHVGYRRDLVPVQRSALVVWKPRHQR
ncbi:MerR family transcriptional regulator [Rhodococcus sp. PAMC28707]|uniref:heat shock protein transcriptional repressor HspR n=1 Tax=unclassified Rhodococcus (in: high G+C Gram-positive bacteria) TaxID=192944 RepID=UPI00109E1E01|nr:MULTISPECIES: helix-turn-helix transcriptional regulator [unclassified Rhodococcus (in: high G+C Gram-positive bacteria)]QCB52595.1 MerR family transcriptional regulator [Rhodococcus sp. PAMC28705]QCB60860.1 MerR family transcriptional regulator [Rhodococcus sp. PAMC28707]